MAPRTSMTSTDAAAFPRMESLAPSPQIEDSGPPTGNQCVYLAVYSNTPVYEMMVRGIGVMRRRDDSYLNATQILKVAGVDKGKRTKILEKDVTGIRQTIQGGGARYQGTWIPFEKGVELAQTYGVAQLIAPLFDYVSAPPPSTFAQQPLLASSTNGQSYHSNGQDGSSSSDGHSPATILSKAREQGLLPEAGPSDSRKRSRESGASEDHKRVKMDSAPTMLPQNSEGVTKDRNLRRSTKAPLNLIEDPHRTDENKTILKSIFAIDSKTTDALIPDFSATLPPDLDPDTPIDDNEHTALHWAAALARISIVQALVNFGADKNRGNNVGETPLIRAVLVTNNSDQDAFLRLLDVLGSSLRTVDDMGRTVLHHAALVAGVKGRASSARYYMESILEYVARNEQGQFKELVDAQDSHGDTALNIAARVGNRGLVRILLEVGADKAIPNKLGLRPGDFGVEGVDLQVTPGDELISSLRTFPSLNSPVDKPETIFGSLNTLLASLSTDFDLELTKKNDSLSLTRAQLLSTTRELAQKRQQVTSLKSKVSSIEQQAQRIKNLEIALAEEDSFDWTGRTEIDGTPCSTAEVGPAFTYRGPNSTLSNLPPGISIEFETDPPLPQNNEETTSLVHLVRLETWYTRVVGLLRQRVQSLEGGHAEHETKLQKIVAGCCGVDPESIDGMLDGLLAALESDGSGLDMARVAGFLSRLKDGSLA